MACAHRLIVLALAVVIALAACADVKAAGPAKPTPVVVHVERGGFHWSDAGIGALAGVGLSLTVCGCLALVRLRGADTTPQGKGVRP
jgi:hypothetical protein